MIKQFGSMLSETAEQFFKETYNKEKKYMFFDGDIYMDHPIYLFMEVDSDEVIHITDPENIPKYWNGDPECNSSLFD